ncbi:MAG: hypothetical protein RIB60_05545 [Phycisphaerales bacterium]
MTELLPLTIMIALSRSTIGLIVLILTLVAIVVMCILLLREEKGKRYTAFYTLAKTSPWVSLPPCRWYELKLQKFGLEIGASTLKLNPRLELKDSGVSRLVALVNTLSPNRTLPDGGRVVGFWFSDSILNSNNYGIISGKLQNEAWNWGAEIGVPRSDEDYSWYFYSKEHDAVPLPVQEFLADHPELDYVQKSKSLLMIVGDPGFPITDQALGEFIESCESLFTLLKV